MRFVLFTLLCFCLCLLDSIARGDDWPEWMGPDRASEWREEGILKTQPRSIGPLTSARPPTRKILQPEM